MYKYSFDIVYTWHLVYNTPLVMCSTATINYYRSEWYYKTFALIDDINWITACCCTPSIVYAKEIDVSETVWLGNLNKMSNM